MLKEYGTSEALSKLISNIQPIHVQNLYEGLKAVSFGEADAVIDSIGTMSYVVMEQTLTNLSIQKIDFLDEQSGQLHFATTKDKAILHSILAKGLKALSAEEHMAIRSRWVLQVDAVQLKNTFKDRCAQSNARRKRVAQSQSKNTFYR